MDNPIMDLEELLEEAKDRIEEKIAIEGGNYDDQKQRYSNCYRILGFV